MAVYWDIKEPLKSNQNTNTLCVKASCGAVDDEPFAKPVGIAETGKALASPRGAVDDEPRANPVGIAVDDEPLAEPVGIAETGKALASPLEAFRRCLLGFGASSV